MKSFLTHKVLFLSFVLLSIWSMPAHAATANVDWAAQADVTNATSQQLFVGEMWKRTELYFGSEKPDGSTVTEMEFQHFVDEEITPRFPDGLTLLTGYGQFRNSTGAIIKERSMVLILLYPLNTGDSNIKVEAIREAYKATFAQESVLRIDSFSLISF